MDIAAFTTRAKREKQTLSIFLDKLDEIVPEGMEEVVAKVDAEVWQEIDCTTCANCCKTMTPVFTKEDVVRISTHLRMSPASFRNKWLKKDETKQWVNTTQPCQFLVDNKCSIYEVRPSDCAEFPHHNKKPFDEYNTTFKNNLVHCPATLMMVEKLKKVVERDFEWE
jgi:Fe-S-cluster containining protein